MGVNDINAVYHGETGGQAVEQTLKHPACRGFTLSKVYQSVEREQ